MTPNSSPIPRPRTAASFPALLPPPAVAALGSTALAKQVMAAALCAGDVDDDRWQPSENGVRHTCQADRARVACLGCPVVQECLELALRAESRRGSGGPIGIRGATAAWERLDLIRQRREATRTETPEAVAS